MAQAKSTKIQLRLDEKMKRWLQRYARGRGGMSFVIRQALERLYQEEEGHEWPHTPKDS